MPQIIQTLLKLVFPKSVFMTSALPEQGLGRAQEFVLFVTVLLLALAFEVQTLNENNIFLIKIDFFRTLVFF